MAQRIGNRRRLTIVGAAGLAVVLIAIGGVSLAMPPVTAGVPAPSTTNAIAAQPTKPAPQSSAVKSPAGAPTKPIIATPEARPLWQELTPAQKNALAPLSADWSGIDLLRKKKWLEIAVRFPSMKPDEQRRLQERMREWAKLSPEERRVAREVYTRTKTLGTDEKSAQWLEYQNLPPAEKQRLADIAAKKRVANLPSPHPLLKPSIMPSAELSPSARVIANKPTSVMPLPLPAPQAVPPAPVETPVSTPTPAATPQPPQFPMIN